MEEKYKKIIEGVNIFYNIYYIYYYKLNKYI